MKRSALQKLLCLLLALLFFVPSVLAYTQGYDGMGPVVLSGGQRDFLWPVPNNHNLQSCFYDRRNHCAIDIAAVNGTPVVASYDGTVVATYAGCPHNYAKSAACCTGFGNYVVLQHSYRTSDGRTHKLFSRYNHLNAVKASVGAYIKKGETVGTVGSTGNSRGFHLDYQILQNAWTSYRTNSIDPYANQLLELPSDLRLTDNWDCGKSYFQMVKELYASCIGGDGCPSRHFSDIVPTQWYHESVDFVLTRSMMDGVSSSTFRPNGDMTRAMLVTVLWRYTGAPQQGVNRFDDVEHGQWYTNAIAWASENGIVTGVAPNRFHPNGSVTREQLATILYRYAQKQGLHTGSRANLSSFSDAWQVSSYAKEALQWCVAEGILTGSSGKLLPQGNATRAQVAAMLMRFIEN